MFSPPGNLKVKKKKIIRGNFNLFHLYFVTFSQLFSELGPPEKERKGLSDLVNNFVFITFKYSYKQYMLLYIYTPSMGVRDHVPCEYFQNNGVIWCIDVYFEDVFLNLFLFLFIEKY